MNTRKGDNIMSQTTQFNYYFYSEDNKSSLVKTLTERGVKNISALAYESRVPTQKVISRLAFRG